MTTFTAATGCKVNAKIDDTSDQMVTDMRQGGGTVYDGVSASGDASNRLISNGDVAEIDVTKIPGFSDVAPFLQNAPHYVVDGKHYGTPHGWGGNELMYNTDVVTTGPHQLGRGLRPDQGAGLQRQDHRLRQPHLHRRRGAVPEGAQARPRASPIRTS